MSALSRYLYDFLLLRLDDALQAFDSSLVIRALTVRASFQSLDLLVQSGDLGVGVSRQLG